MILPCSPVSGPGTCFGFPATSFPGQNARFRARAVGVRKEPGRFLSVLETLVAKLSESRVTTPREVTNPFPLGTPRWGIEPLNAKVYLRGGPVETAPLGKPLRPAAQVQCRVRVNRTCGLNGRQEPIPRSITRCQTNRITLAHQLQMEMANAGRIFSTRPRGISRSPSGLCSIG
jgi:hypothetical protein